VPSPALSVSLFATGAFARTTRDSTGAPAAGSAQQRHTCYGAEAEFEEAPAVQRSLLLGWL
jgi:hypothetical protein